jgi:hypothetical protein
MWAVSQLALYDRTGVMAYGMNHSSCVDRRLIAFGVSHRRTYPSPPWVGIRARIEGNKPGMHYHNDVYYLPSSTLMYSCRAVAAYV